MKILADELIQIVAEEISQIVPECLGVTLGGSRAYGLEDSISDVEMYFYSYTGAPALNDINNCLIKFQASHKRCDQFLWDSAPWGPHSFFVIEGLYFEIGYRNILEVEEKLKYYQDGNVAPIQDCHDLGLGYMMSGLAASIASEKILLSTGDELIKLKKQALLFPDNLIMALKKEYLDTARELLNGKLLAAAKREDIFCYDVISNRIVRCLFVMAYALSKKHFPGDKWNEPLIKRSNWSKKEAFLRCLKDHSLNKAQNAEELLLRREYLVQAIFMIDETLEEKNGKPV